MLYLTRRPIPPLCEFVEYLWLLSDVPQHSLERILPTGTLELVVNLFEDEIRIHDSAGVHGKRFSGMVVSGAYGRYFVIDTAEHALTMGVHFRPGGAHSILRFPAIELADTHVDVQALWGQAACELRERLCLAATHEQRFMLLEKALSQRAERATEHNAAVDFAARVLQQQGSQVRDIACQVGMSHRRLIELFAARVGMNPKLYGRVNRFQRALSVASQKRVKDWGQFAIECGYYDQSHFIHDFSTFSGFTPAGYPQQPNNLVKANHVALR